MVWPDLSKTPEKFHLGQKGFHGGTAVCITIVIVIEDPCDTPEKFHLGQKRFHGVVKSFTAGQVKSFTLDKKGFTAGQVCVLQL